MDSPSYQANRMIGDQGYPAFELRHILAFTVWHFGEHQAQALLRAIGLDSNTVQHSQFVAVWQVDYALRTLARLSNDPEIGARIGATYKLAGLDILLPHFAGCRTLRDCLAVVTRLPRLVGSLSDTLVLEEQGELAMRWLNTGRFEENHYHTIFTHSIGVLLTLARELTGVRVEYSRLAFQVPKFAGDYLRGMTRARLAFEQTYCEWVVSEQMLALPVTYSFNHAGAPAPQPLSPSLIDILLAQLHEHFPQIPRLEELAGSLNMSDRSLRRKLAALGTGYQPLVDMVRAQSAIAGLLSGQESITDIAEQLGYVDVSHFRQSFKHWTGHAPGHFVSLNSSSPEM
ncbi:MAG: AraC family transcriptional regulator [Shewanella sp.]|nr:AraC family transcriptional regulator [Shewanella sp.]MCF1429595.1 AraC family transcriptional regulator [Shewanella sp.]MCF1458374.1 AraC family transcriptional regulator [Shewanella sp.]